MAAVSAGARGNDERVRYVQCAHSELFAAAAGDGMGRNAAARVCKSEPKNESALGLDIDLRDVLGAVPRAAVRTPDYSGYHALRSRSEERRVGKECRVRGERDQW